MTSLKMAEVEVVVGGGKSGFQPTTISRRDQEILSSNAIDFWLQT